MKKSIFVFFFSIFCLFLLDFCRFCATGNVSIGSLHGFEVPLYFEMPAQFLGDRLLSYAGHFVYGIEMKECKTELDRTIIERFPLIQLHSHDSIILEYFGVSSNYPIFAWYISLFSIEPQSNMSIIAGIKQHQSKHNVQRTLHRATLATQSNRRMDFPRPVHDVIAEYNAIVRARHHRRCLH